MARPLANRAAYGNAVVSRFSDIGISGGLKADFAAFKAQHLVFVKATGAVAKAEHGYDEAATRVAKLDVTRDRSILALADKIPGAGLGARTSPFARYSKEDSRVEPGSARVTSLRPLRPLRETLFPPYR